MWLEKDGNKIELDNPISIDAFKSNGYKEVKERAKTPAPKPEKEKPVAKPAKKPTKRTSKNA